MDDKLNVFIDTNVLIDYLARREPFFTAAALVIQLGQRRKCNLLVSSLSFATTSVHCGAFGQLRQMQDGSLKGVTAESIIDEL